VLVEQAVAAFSSSYTATVGSNKRGLDVRDNQRSPTAILRTLSSVAVTALLATAVLCAQTIDREPERERWQRVAEIVRVMEIGPGRVVADVGAGDGFLTVRLAPVVGGTGRVYAVDIADRRLEFLRRRVGDANLQNVVVVKGEADDPHLPVSQLDAAVILNSYHEMPRGDDVLRHIRESLKPGGRLLIAEPSPQPGEVTRTEQITKHHIGSAFVAQEMVGAGFSIVDRRDEFAKIPDGGWYSLVVGQRPLQPRSEEDAAAEIKSRVIASLQLRSGAAAADATPGRESR
jgi:predicted methyltransferase